MSLEQTIYEQRRAKLQQLRALGCDPYPRRFAYSHTLGELIDGYSSRSGEELEAERLPVRVSGRVMALRAQGKAGFAHLMQGGRRLQIYVRKDAVDERSFAIWKLLDLGDFIGVTGYLFRTRTGELTVHAEQIEFLAKDLLPLPEKWHGLQDVERRYRQRYLDLVVNQESRAVFMQRAKVVQSLRNAFHERGYMEVETPMMQPIAGGAAARPFVTHHNTLNLTLYLRIAPELYLKRLIVGGLERVYEINRNFRNEGISTHHNPEFTMLEFYEAYSDYNVLMDWSEVLLARVAREVTGSEQVKFGDNVLDFSQFRRLTLRDAICEYWPAAAGPAPTREEVRNPAMERAITERYNRITTPGGRFQPIEIRGDEAEGVLLTALFEAVAEDHLVQPTIIHEFPASVSPLAKNKADEPAWVDRFEIYIAGMEIANGYSELNDPEEQRLRFEQQLQQRAQGDDEAHEMDEDYVRALQYGMPPTAGEGIGIDRLCMLLTDSRSIRDVILFPLMRPGKKAEQGEESSAAEAGEASS